MQGITAMEKKKRQRKCISSQVYAVYDVSYIYIATVFKLLFLEIILGLISTLEDLFFEDK